jgi:hypothetical protein
MKRFRETDVSKVAPLIARAVRRDLRNGIDWTG